MTILRPLFAIAMTGMYIPPETDLESARRYAQKIQNRNAGNQSFIGESFGPHKKPLDIIGDGIHAITFGQLQRLAELSSRFNSMISKPFFGSELADTQVRRFCDNIFERTRDPNRAVQISDEEWDVFLTIIEHDARDNLSFANYKAYKRDGLVPPIHQENQDPHPALELNG